MLSRRGRRDGVVVGVGLGVNLHVAHEALSDVGELVSCGFRHGHPFWIGQDRRGCVAACAASTGGASSAGSAGSAGHMGGAGNAGNAGGTGRSRQPWMLYAFTVPQLKTN